MTTTEPDETAYRIERARGSVIEYHDWGDGVRWAETVECVFCGVDLRGRQLADHLLTCEKADREVRY